MYLVHLSVYIWSKWKNELKNSHLAHFIGFKLSYCVWSCSKLGSMTPLKVNSTGAVCTLDLQSQLHCSSVHTRPSKSTQMQQHAHKALKVNSTAAACTQGLGSQLNYGRMHTRPCEFHPIDIVWRFAGHYINIKIFFEG